MRKLQQGFSIVSAIFLLVVLAFLGVGMTMFSTNQHQSEAMDVLGARAYQAARAGIEWAAYNVALSPASAVTPATCATNLSGLGGVLSNFSVAVSCSTASAVEGASTIWIYDVTSTATAGIAGGPDYIERVVTVKMGK